MRQNFTQECNGYIVTVWMVALELWAYRVTKGAKMYPAGYVNAVNRTDAAAAAYAEVLETAEA